MALTLLKQNLIGTESRDLAQGLVIDSSGNPILLTFAAKDDGSGEVHQIIYELSQSTLRPTKLINSSDVIPTAGITDAFEITQGKYLSVASSEGTNNIQLASTDINSANTNFVPITSNGLRYASLSINEIDIGGDNSIYLAGNVSGDFDGISNLSQGYTPVFFKTNTDGEIQWAILPDQTVYDHFYTVDMAVNPRGDVFALYDSTVTKFSASGIVQWSKALPQGGTSYHDIDIMSDGSLLISNGDHLSKLNSQSGDTIWSLDAPGTYTFTDIVETSGGAVVAAVLTADKLFEISPDGQVIGSIETGWSFGGEPTKLTYDTSSESLYLASVMWNQANHGNMTFQGGYWDVLVQKYLVTAEPEYSLSAVATSYSEGEIARFSLQTTGLSNGTSVSYTLSGISSADLASGSLTGTTTVNSSGVATINVAIKADNLTEGREQLTVSVANGVATASTYINDTSTTLTSYSLTPPSSINEGDTGTFSLQTTGLSNGTSVSYTLSGISSADLASGSLTGTTTVNSSGVATINVAIKADNLTEGREQLTVSVANGVATASTYINDTSTTPSTSGGTSSSSDIVSKSYSVASTAATVRSSDGGQTWTVTTSSGTETLTNYDRLSFSDKTIALDFDEGEAGYNAATMIGAAFGSEYIDQYFGTGVTLFDAGMTVSQIAQLIVDTGLIEGMVGSTTEAWVDHVYENVVGAAPDAFTSAAFSTLLSNGTYTKAGLLELAAGVDALESQIDLVGLQSHGLDYVTFI